MSYQVQCCCPAHPVLVVGPDPGTGEYECQVCGRTVLVTTSTVGIVIMRGRGPREHLTLVGGTGCN